MQNIKKKFQLLYPAFPFPEGQARGFVQVDNLKLQYLFGKDQENHDFMDIYGNHRMGSIHLRIKHDGEVKALETYEEGFSYDPEIAGDEERAEKEYREHNERVGKLLLEKFY